MKLKYLFLLITILWFASCQNETQQQDAISAPNTSDTTVSENTPLGVGDALEQEMPVPGAGTITSHTTTPLKEQTKALYKDAQGNTIHVVYYFDKNNRGIAILQRQGVDDLTLYQELDDIPSNSAYYTDGHFSWNVIGTIAEFDNGSEVRKYFLQKAAQ